MSKGTATTPICIELHNDCVIGDRCTSQMGRPWTEILS